ncbi:alpha-L-rhamnosidase C-terminal domain-containing protein [Mangrovibacterium marinum]|uniref:Alpha-L-rhamnosidase-like protein n=1 Tax=Mangrovibacterium marinum TaxID=1639118 RepID=A0A2T5BYX9_9BACT|nr:alpha-L-rhamnosidase C-terminal domain-containing protein [Mangrovibacterium marinum]PTN07452.1 alpha-L-rhamnosidase-like protein [Mangrovibacterium marinum]
MTNLKSILLSLLLFVVIGSNAQQINPDLLTKAWRAYWITVPNEIPGEYGVYRFRKDVTLTENPEEYIVHVSGDNRYKLFVNGQLVAVGPAGGDKNNWNFETVDIAPFLQEGVNVIAAVVWNEGKYRAVVQTSQTTGFILQGNSRKEYDFNTNSKWLCCKDVSYQPLEQKPVGYFALGPGEMVDMNQSPTDWMEPDFSMENWFEAEQITPGVTKASATLISSPWLLVPSEIPPVELTQQRLAIIRRAEGISVPKTFPAEKSKITVPANSKVQLLLDQNFLTNAYPTLEYSKGKDAVVSMKYAEALYDSTMAKGNRNEIEGKSLIGREDRIVCNGLDNQQYTPLSWRTYRYLQVDIQTKNEALVLDDIYGTFVGYPFKNNTAFQSDLPVLDSILQIGWRTARLCAVDTYFDCPYYEQLQYIGDTRIQMMVSYFNSGDDRLARRAINLIDKSRLPEGITQSRYPGGQLQIITPFSLLWIGMVSDYYHYRPDVDFVKSKLMGIRQVLAFYANYQQEDGSVKDLPYWNFTDWAENKSSKWRVGAPPVSKQGYSSVIDLQLLWAMQLASELERDLGMACLADEYQQKAAHLQQTIKDKYWDDGRKMFADTDERNYFSEHANVLAILTGTISGDDATNLFKRIIYNPDLTQTSIYFKYYLNRAMIKAGLGNEYLNHLDIWKKNIQLGMTTWGEDSQVERTRSDCHAWGASPNIEFFRTVLGIDSDAPGFSKVKIEPHLGDLKKASGSMPHPQGAITVSYALNKKKWTIRIELPEGLTGSFVWNGISYEIQSGGNEFKL